MEKSIGEYLEEFLIENNCFSQFCINLLEQAHRTFEEHVSYYNEFFDNTDWLTDKIFYWNISFSDAFYFKNAPEGEDFWINLYLKWKKDY